ncbi:MAG: ATP-binding protein [Pseudomonadota bacterium]|nr:ATP-binding protein [Pseudomonadota bacterium]
MPFSQFLGKSIVWIVGAVWILVSVVWLTFNSLQVREILPQETALRQTLLTADEALIDLNNQLGFGGFIHNFKNAVLRPAEKQRYLEAFRQDTLAIHRSSQQLLTYYPDMDEQIGALLSTVQEYEEKAEFLSQTPLTDPLEIDPLVRVSDENAIEALLDIVHQNQVATIQLAAELNLRKARLYGLSGLLLFGIILTAVGLYAYALLIVQRNRANTEAIRLSAEMVEGMNAAILRLDTQGEIEASNKNARKLFGDILEPGSEPLITRLMHSFPSVRSEDPLFRAFLGTPVDNEVGLYTLPDGSQRYLRILGMPRSDDLGDRKGVIEVSDVTEKVVADTLKEQNRNVLVLGQMARGIVHDVRNINATLRFTLKTLAKRGGSDDAQGLIENANAALSASDQLTKRLLDFATAGQEQMRTYSLSEVFGTLRSLSGGLTLGDTAIVIEPAPETAYLSGNPDALLAALINLVVNARNALSRLPEVQGEIRVSVVPGETVIGHQGWRICLVDNGPGFPDAILAGAQPGRIKGEGYGLGLSIARSVAADMGGYMDLSNRPEGGARVVLELPAALADPEHDAEETGESAAPILVVDDSHTSAWLMTRELQALGYPTLIALTPQEALTVIRGTALRAVISDLDLRDDMSGYDVLAAAQTITASLPVMLFTRTPELAKGHPEVPVFGKGKDMKALLSHLQAELEKTGNAILQE